ncbi:L,D-transpeptidase family protein [Litoribrevibacter euphylliae]|uniref:L,D-transpeptidase family protein n=1 Tax=Litoribrevibacter euphylliae TaxID=1834034 RepID=A0ABV7HF19_9GAMM
MIHISIKDQRLDLIEEGQVLRSYSISTAKNGAGENNGSGQTPRGKHIIRAKIGDGQPINAVFVGRRATGEVYTSDLAEAFPERDWILSRILWLSGCEPGKNRLGSKDSMRRYIYIHGTPDSEPMGVALSHGCVRMRNKDVIDLFDLVPVGIPVEIVE